MILLHIKNQNGKNAKNLLTSLNQVGILINVAVIETVNKLLAADCIKKY
jgi:hypothetical protein